MTTMLDETEWVRCSPGLIRTLRTGSMPGCLVCSQLPQRALSYLGGHEHLLDAEYAHTYHVAALTGAEGFLRLLVTASRTWTDAKRIWDVLGACLHAARAVNCTLVVVHGDEEQGGDRDAKLFGQVVPGAIQEPHPADWHRPCLPACKPGHRKPARGGGDCCPGAGMDRNADMIKFGPYWRCAAFIRNGSPGASGCARLAKSADIDTRVIHWDQGRR